MKENTQDKCFKNRLVEIGHKPTGDKDLKAKLEAIGLQDTITDYVIFKMIEDAKKGSKTALNKLFDTLLDADKEHFEEAIQGIF